MALARSRVARARLPHRRRVVAARPESFQMQDSLDLRALRDIGLSHDTVQAAIAHGRPDDARLARIIEIRRDCLVVHDGVRAHDAVPWPTLRVALELERDQLVVGDWVWWRAVADGPRGWIVARIAARNRLSRRD